MGKRHFRDTLLDLVDRNALEHPGVLATVDGDSRLSWSRYREQARAIALALGDLGVRHGDVVGLQMCNRAEHVLSDIGALMAGAVPVSFYNTLSEEQLSYVAHDSAATVVIVDAAHVPLWQKLRATLPALRHVVALDLDLAQPLPDGVIPFSELVETAQAQLLDRGPEVDKSISRVRSDDPLTVVYTSGTTGPPKGTIITHEGVLWVLAEVYRHITEHIGGPIPVGWTTVSYLPLAHVAERVFSHYQAITRVITVTYVRNLTDLPHVLPSARPYLFLGVPRVWEKVYSKVRERLVESRSPVRRLIGRTAISVAYEMGTERYGGAPAGRRAHLLYPIMERIVYQKIRATLGLDRVVLAVSGAASLSDDITAFFAGMGINISDAYGMTESSAMLTGTPLDAPRLGTVGRPLLGLELKIAEDGEILVRGPNITPGYLNRPDATEEAIDAAGWLHTGDLGSLDDDGYLSLIGRKKELINTASGKTISPSNVEMVLSERSSLVGTVYVHGDQKPCLVALVSLDPGWPDWCAERGIEVGSCAEAVAHGRVRLEVARTIGAGNATLSRVEQVKNWVLLEDVWSSESGELTPTMKLKRSVIVERYWDEIEQLYDPLTAESWADD